MKLIVIYMKKVVRTLTAIVLTAAMAAPITASAATIESGSQQTVSGANVSSQQTAETKVNLNAEAMYIVTIPATIELKQVDDTAIYQGNGEITANRVHLDEGKKLQVTLESDFQLDAELGDSLTYEAATDANFDQKIQTGGVVGHFAASTGSAADDPLSIYFRTTQELTYAGNYSDKVTFSFKEVNND